MGLIDPDKGFKKGPKKFFPSWRYSAECVEGKIFQRPEDVPEGWVDHPSKIVVADAVEDIPEAPARESKPLTPPPQTAQQKAAATRAATRAKQEADKRDALMKKLLKAGYDPAELAAASMDELTAEAAKVPDNGPDVV